MTGFIRIYVFIAACIALYAFPQHVSALTGDDDTRNTRTAVYSPLIRTLSISTGAETDVSNAVIKLNSPERVTINFDELSEERRYMCYRIEHCNMDWIPDGLPEQMYLNGFNRAEVNDYSFSSATTVHYVNYRITIPSPDMEITASGNYLLTVYDEEQPDSTLLQVRFSMVESAALISGEVSGITDIDYRKGHQQLNLCVDLQNLNLNNPLSEISTRIIQNGDYINTHILNRPLRITGSKLYYEHDPALIFKAGNEFRRFETVSLRYPTMSICSTSFTYPYYYTEICTDEPRSDKAYSYDRTQHGAFRVRNSDISGDEHPDIDADYAVTKFTLQMPRLNGYDVFIDGDLNLNCPIEPMEYNYETGSYEQSLFLKQGSYNYRYVSRPVNSMTLNSDSSLIEGNFYQTSNRYTVLVYLRKPGDLYDRLVACATIDT